jgi:hypothetical protein
MKHEKRRGKKLQICGDAHTRRVDRAHSSWRPEDEVELMNGGLVTLERVRGMHSHTTPPGI